jgi:hypothetical protein
MPPLPAGYAKWLETPRWYGAGELDLLDLVVYETREWRRRMPRIVDHWAEIHTALVDFLYDDPKGVTVDSACPGVRIVTTRERVAVATIYRRPDEDCPRRLLMLLDAFDENKPDSDAPTREKWLVKLQAELSAGFKGGSLETLARRAIRAYPGLYLDHDAYEAWTVIEQDESANLAMSSEEESLLTNLTGSQMVAATDEPGPEASSRDSMPAFINGRAGSGKSTVLYYLFAHYWIYGKQKELPGHPLFLTLSGRLLNAARKTVKSILEADCRYLAASGTPSATVMDGLDEAFRPFRSILLDTLSPRRRLRFAEDREIDFDVFRRLLLNHDDPRYPAKLRFMGRLDRWCTPELCWHVIRSYVKGFSPRGLMDGAAYRSLPRMDRSVDNEHFDWVFARVWPWYAGLTDRGDYWDQQDLAREVWSGLNDGTLELPDRLRDCGAVFCDEAQDLTGVELSLVLRLSVFARHDLRDLHHVRKIPIAFAGDPLQTLNPTGFRWENLTSSFYRNLLEPLGLHKPLNRSELHFNYRSPQLITRLANLVQFSRRVIFHDAYLQPQRPWSLDEGVPPARFDIPTEFTESELSGLQDSFIVLPCADGHEAEFAAKYPVLERLTKATSPPELISVSAAKGLDLKKVVVFAFGEELFRAGLPEPADEEESGRNVGLAYALNQLYVAVTRSTDELLIMDTQRGHETLWDQLFDQERMDGALRQLDSATAGAWRDVLPRQPLPHWNTGIEFAPLKPEDLRAQAESLKNSGKELRRSEFMQKAAAFYHKAGRSDEERECRAYADWYSGRHREAADTLRRLHKIKEAADCLWEGRCWPELVGLGSEIDPKRGTLSAFIISDQPAETRLRRLLDAQSDLKFELDTPSVPQWREVVSGMIAAASEILRSPSNTVDDQVFRVRIGRTLRDLGHLGHGGCLELAADCFAAAADWAAARQVLDVVPATARVESRDLVLAHTSNWPEYVRACQRARTPHLLVERWRGHGRPTSGLSRAEAVLLFESLWAESQTGEAIEVGFAAGLVQELWNVRRHLSMNEWVRVLRLAAERDRSTLPVEAELDDLWRKRSELNSDERLELFETLCVVEQWEQVAELSREISEGRPRPIDMDWMCDAIAAHPVLGRISDADMKVRDTIGDTLLGAARKLGEAWPAGEIELRRAAAALESLGFDKHLAALGRAYGDGRSDAIRTLSRRIYQRARALYEERLEQLAASSRLSGLRREQRHDDRLKAETETREQLTRWGMLSPPEKGEPFVPPPRIALGARQQPFEKCSTPVQEMESFWITEFAPYAIQVARGTDGRPTGTVEVSRRDGRRPKILFIDTSNGDVELSDGTRATMTAGKPQVDTGLGGSIEVMRTEELARLVVRLPPWPSGVTIVLPTGAMTSVKA